jgi:hypothetical protein
MKMNNIWLVSMIVMMLMISLGYSMLPVETLEGKSSREKSLLSGEEQAERRRESEAVDLSANQKRGVLSSEIGEGAKDSTIGGQGNQSIAETGAAPIPKDEDDQKLKKLEKLVDEILATRRAEAPRQVDFDSFYKQSAGYLLMQQQRIQAEPSEENNRVLADITTANANVCVALEQARSHQFVPNNVEGNHAYQVHHLTSFLQASICRFIFLNKGRCPVSDRCPVKGWN